MQSYFFMYRSHFIINNESSISSYSSTHHTSHTCIWILLCRVVTFWSHLELGHTRERSMSVHINIDHISSTTYITRMLPTPLHYVVALDTYAGIQWRSHFRKRNIRKKRQVTFHFIINNESSVSSFSSTHHIGHICC